MQMLTGGVTILVLSAVTGEFSSFHISHVAPRSWLALAFLIGPGSILALSAYNVAVRRLSTSTVATYPYVNPVVAVILGATLLNETTHARHADRRRPHHRGRRPRRLAPR